MFFEYDIEEELLQKNREFEKGTDSSKKQNKEVK